MRKLICAIAFGAWGILAAPLGAVEDPVAARQALMASVGASAAVGGGMLQGEIDYSPAVGRAVIAAINATAQTYGDFFPEESRGDERSEARETIWQDRAGFEATLAEFQEAAAAAVEAAGREGPPDVAAFQAALQPVLGSCRTCHETYRVQN